MKERCFTCGLDIAVDQQKCGNCGTRFWESWDTSWYSNPMLEFSSGKSQIGRKVGHLVFLFCTVSSLSICLYVALFQTKNIEMLGLWGFALICMFGAYEVRSFFYGKITMIKHWAHDCSPGNTNWRVFGLLGDLFIIGLSFHVLFKGLNDAF
jgi:hypothetical protein